MPEKDIYVTTGRESICQLEQQVAWVADVVGPQPHRELRCVIITGAALDMNSDHLESPLIPLMLYHYSFKEGGPPVFVYIKYNVFNINPYKFLAFPIKILFVA